VNPRERFLAMMRGEPHDRVPIELYGFWHPDRASVEVVTDPLKRKIGERIVDELIFRTKVDAPLNRMLGTPPQRIRTTKKPLPNGHARVFGTIDTPKGELTFVEEWDPCLLYTSPSPRD